MARTIPNYSIEIAWSGLLTGVFTIGRSTLGGADVIGGTFGGNVFDDVTSRVERFQIHRGRNAALGPFQQGVCTLELVDTDGTYNPENPASPLAGYLVPMRPVRVRATHLGTTYGLFYGFISRIEHDPDLNVQHTVFEAVDFFEWLSLARPVIASMGATTVGAAIAALLTAVEWTDPALRSLDAGSSIQDFSADGSRSALQLIEDLLAIDLGVFFVSGAGVATYRDHTGRFARGTPVATLTGTMVTGTRPSTDVRQIANRQTVTRTGGVAQTVTDTPSRIAYGYRDGSAITSPYLSSDTQASSLASILVMLLKDPRLPTHAVAMIDTDDATTPIQLARELGDRVSLGSVSGGTAIDGIIESIALVFDAVTTTLESTFLLSKRVFDMFTIGTSQIGGTDVIGY